MSTSRNRASIEKLSWTKLNVAQMSRWPNQPRRFLLALFALLFALILGWLIAKPLFEQLQSAKIQTVNIQEQYVQTVKRNAQQRNMQANARTIADSAVSAVALPAWLSMIAQTAQQQNLYNVSLLPLYPKSSDAKANGASGAASSQDHIVSKNALLNDPHVGQLTISATGKYSDLLKWASLVSTRDEILGVDEITMQAAKNGGVHWQARMLFAQEVQP